MAGCALADDDNRLDWDTGRDDRLAKTPADLVCVDFPSCQGTLLYAPAHLRNLRRLPSSILRVSPQRDRTLGQSRAALPIPAPTRFTPWTLVDLTMSARDQRLRGQDRELLPGGDRGQARYSR